MDGGGIIGHEIVGGVSVILIVIIRSRLLEMLMCNAACVENGNNVPREEEEEFDQELFRNTSL